MKVRSIVILSVVLVLFALSLFYIFYIRKNIDKTDSVSGQDTNSQVSSQAEWNQGALVNAITDATGFIKIDNTGFGEISLKSVYDANPNSVSANVSEDSVPNLVDENYTTEWGFNYTEETCGWTEFPIHWWKIDLGQQAYVGEVGLYDGHINYSEWDLYWSTDDVTYNNANFFDYSAPWRLLNVNQTFRYLRIQTEPYNCGGVGGCPDCPWEPDHFAIFEGIIKELRLTTNNFNNATHTTASTQIDGQEGSADKTLIEWTSFTPTQTTPAGTSVQYQFRTSSDGASWNNWSAEQGYSGSPLDLTGLTASRYLQVKAELITNSALSTPQIDDYTINFHNNQAPNQPTAQTATFGD